MSINLKLSAAALLIAASSTCAMAQATGKENNATTGSESGSGPASGADQKGGDSSMKGEMKSSPGASGASGSSAGQPSGVNGTADKPDVGAKDGSPAGSAK